MSDPKPKSKVRKPNFKQRLFVKEVLSNPGQTITESYQKIYPNSSYNTARQEGSAMLRRPHVAQHINEVLAERYPDLASSSANFMTSALADPNVNINAKLKIIDMFARYLGWAAPVKNQSVTATVDLTKFKLPGSSNE